jgi:hypothetical protein
LDKRARRVRVLDADPVDLPGDKCQGTHDRMDAAEYRVSRIRCSTVRHERGYAACPRREQGKATLRRLAANRAFSENAVDFGMDCDR